MLAQFKSRFLVIFLLTFVLTAPAYGLGSREKSRSLVETCRALLTAFRQIGPQNGPLARSFFTSPALFYNDGVMRTEYNGGFPASNEYDWHLTPWDTSPTDMVIGFGSNSAWDIAARKRAKDLIIADHIAAPLIAQNYILRPILRLAQTPAEFLAVLAGAPLSEDRKNASLFEMGEYLVGLESDNYRDDVEGLLKWMLNQGISGNEFRALAGYYVTLASNPTPNRAGVLRAPGIEQVGDLQGFFAQRYLPQLRMEDGFEGPTHPEDSFLSSQEAYSRFKALYENAKYAHTDFASEEFYRKVKRYGDQKGYRSYTISLTNIIDTTFSPKSHAMHQLNLFRQMIYRLFPKDEYDVTLFMTTSHRMPHGFYRIARDTVIKPEQWIRYSEPAER